ncbi:ABC transporter [miscellaneous Crenarchaeota group-15 archaeon DG-45]|uniref:ABC transporter n=1 Tax=miscellaneous Crenarchaeota group-15 archaeon DG-45 TaxID=1685127 RepID=A0A0M0BQ60_9ARCH|nr:MAG: ABC transporter [miscellaneous Crenarchaeota group-15 archaeon DG-45]
MSFDTIIELEDLARYYEMGGVTIQALDGVDLQIGRGEYLSIVGPSGSGKTTLFNMVGGLDRPSRGKVYIDGVDISKLDAYELAWLRCRKIGYIFQTFNLIQVLTAVENVALPTIFAGVPRDEGLERAEKLLTSVGLGERLHHRPSELSAGQQQRVAIARAMANDPDIILADEPTGNLDLNTGMEIIDILHGLNKTRGMTLIAATHDLKMIKASDRIVWLRDGKIERIERG